MQDSYKSAVNKIKIDPEFEQKLKARLARENTRVAHTRPDVTARMQWRRLMAVSTAAVLLLTVISASFIVPRFLDGQESVADITDTYSSDNLEYVPTTGYNAISLAQNLSYRITAEENAIHYDTNIHFRFEGFDKYNIHLKESCIVFNTSLDASYTLANFISDYYKLIINGNGISYINNGLLESMFDIGENGIRTISICDDKREIIDLDTTLMSHYADMDNVYFTISIT